MGRKCSGFGAATGALNPGAFVCFADPSQTALDVSLFWRPEKFSSIVTARVRNQQEFQHGSVIRLGDACCRRTLLKTHDGLQYILFQARNRAAQLRCNGDDIRIDPFSLEVIVDGFPDVETSQRLIKRLADVYRNRGPERQPTRMDG